MTTMLTIGKSSQDFSISGFGVCATVNFADKLRDGQFADFWTFINPRA